MWRGDESREWASSHAAARDRWGRRRSPRQHWLCPTIQPGWDDDDGDDRALANVRDLAGFHEGQEPFGRQRLGHPLEAREEPASGCQLHAAGDLFAAGQAGKPIDERLAGGLVAEEFPATVPPRQLRTPDLQRDPRPCGDAQARQAAVFDRRGSGAAAGARRRAHRPHGETLKELPARHELLDGRAVTLELVKRRRGPNNIHEVAHTLTVPTPKPGTRTGDAAGRLRPPPWCWRVVEGRDHRHC